MSRNGNRPGEGAAYSEGSLINATEFTSPPDKTQALRGRPGLVYFAVPNGGSRDIREAVHLRRAGVLPGVSDIVLLYEGRAYFLELKSDNGRLSEHQHAFLASVNEAGGYSCAAYGLDEAVRCLEAWQLVTGRGQ
jgi:hypothetical protein